MNERLKNSIEVLQKAYLEEELEAGNCEACAVGNLVAASSRNKYSYEWRFVFCTEEQTQIFYNRGDDFLARNVNNYDEGMKAIEATGYSVEELAKIEYAFERAVSRDEDDELFTHVSQWIRLKAVIKVLFEIEGIPYNQEVEEPFLEKALS